MGLKLEQGKLVHYRWGGPEVKVVLNSLDQEGWTKIIIVNIGTKANIYENGQFVQTVN